MKELFLGSKLDKSDFCIPEDAITEKFAFLGISGSGKTSCATVLAEELHDAGHTFVTLDPVGVWWGMRSKPDGKGRGFPVVVFGGDNADLPLEKGSGQRIAEALACENVSAIIDLSGESKTFWRQIVTDICVTLMSQRPAAPKMVFIEEAPEFVPQRASADLSLRCMEAVERISRMGRNRGYGVSLISQRPATVNKDALSQCENLFVFRTTGAHDRKALLEWIEGNASDSVAKKFLDDLATLKSGEAYFWSPRWQAEFLKMHFRQRETYHPGATWTAGSAQQKVSLVDVGDFVSRLKVQLTKITVTKPEPKMKTEEYSAEEQQRMSEMPDLTSALQTAQAESQRLKAQVAQLTRDLGSANRRVEALRKHLKPQYEALKSLFDEMGEDAVSAGVVDRAVYEPWLAKAGKRGCRRMLETLLDKPELTKAQLGTLTGVAATKSTFRQYQAWLTQNGLIEVNGDMIKLLVP